MRSLEKVILGLIGILIFAIVTGITFDFLQDQKPQTEPLGESTKQVLTSSTNIAVVDAINEVDDCVVSIRNYQEIQGEQVASSNGSGVIFKKSKDKIYILTNAHVVSTAEKTQVEFSDRSTAKATLLGRDEDTDIAVLTIENKDVKSPIKIAKPADMSRLRIGEEVYAVGNALGIGQTVTRGIISALDRSLELRSQFAYSLIQTDAAINPGNSGGALVNDRGEVIGINTIKIAQVSNRFVEGFGFAIPIDKAYEIAEALIEKGYLPKTFLGVKTRDLDLNYLKAQGIPTGVLVVSVVSGSPAQTSGLQENDLILSVNGHVTANSASLGNFIRSMKEGDKVKLKVYRDGEILAFELILSTTSS